MLYPAYSCPPMASACTLQTYESICTSVHNLLQDFRLSKDGAVLEFCPDGGMVRIPSQHLSTYS